MDPKIESMAILAPMAKRAKREKKNDDTGKNQ